MAVAVALMLAAQFAAPRLAAEIRVPLPGQDTKPNLLKKKRFFRPTMPARNPDRVTASISAAVAPSTTSTTDGEASSAAGATASASTAVAAQMPPAAPMETASLPSDPDTDAARAGDGETEPAETVNDSAGDDSEPSADTADAASSDEAPAPEAPAEAQQTSEPISPAEQANEATETAEESSDEAEEKTATAAEASPATGAEPVETEPPTEPVETEQASEPEEPEQKPETAEVSSDDATKPTEVAEVSPLDQAAPEPAESAEDEEPTEPVETEQASKPEEPELADDAETGDEAEKHTAAVTDTSPPDDVAETAETSSQDATVVIDVAPPPDDAEPVKTAALTPPSEPAPDRANPAVDEKPEAEEPESAASELSDTETKPDADEPDETMSAETPSSDGAAETATEQEEASSSDHEAEAQAVEPPKPPAHPTVAAVRAKLAEPDLRKTVAASDLKALQSFYGDHQGPPLWVTSEGFSAKAQALIEEIERADDWGLDSASFDVPPAADLLATPNAQVDDELQLSISALKYARHAQGGRRKPIAYSPLFDQRPTIRDPKAVLTELAAADEPDAYLTSLHPQHEQFKRLRKALAAARARAEASGGSTDADRDVQLIAINMERWRWVPRSLGAYHVWNNVPEFNVRVMKGGKAIYLEKTIVGQYKYATPFFSAPMRNIVFHPNWTVPPTIVKEDLAPKLRGPGGGGFFGNSKTNTLRRYGLSVSYKGRPIDADSVDWNNVNIHAYTFTQEPGPANVLGRFKFNFPNKHAIYMHDTVQPELFAERTRTLSHGCIRVNQPDRLATLLLAEDKGWSGANVRNLVAKDSSTVINFKRHVPVHLTYFTATVDENGTLNRFGDIYGIDNRMAAKLFDKPAKFPVPAQPTIAESGATDQSRQRRRSSGGLDNFISGLFGN